MILRTTNLQDAKVERECRVQLRNLLGDEDEAVLTEWIWDNNRNPVVYVESLVAVAQQTMEKGRAFANNLLSVAKKPKHVREAEMAIMAFVTPLINELAERIRRETTEGQTLSEAARDTFVAEARDEFLYRLQEKLYNMFPDKHRATMTGAIMSSFVIANGAFSINIGTLVKTLHLEDPLKATAASSR